MLHTALALRVLCAVCCFGLQSNQEMPDVMPSMDFKRVWQSGPLSAAAAASSAGRGQRDSRVLSVWRPVGPPGYSSLGDVVVAGSEPPSGKPVRMYKDVVGAGDAPGQVSTPGTHQQRLMAIEECDNVTTFQVYGRQRAWQCAA